MKISYVLRLIRDRVIFALSFLFKPKPSTIITSFKVFLCITKTNFLNITHSPCRLIINYIGYYIGTCLRSLFLRPLPLRISGLTKRRRQQDPLTIAFAPTNSPCTQDLFRHHYFHFRSGVYMRPF